MSSNTKMLIDATHPEETRVVVQRNGRVEEFDFESAARKLLRGNIYLAKVTRVEPSLQAAFVDYGGNRHGFLAFNEIHPDYYQIPVADRQALIEEQAAAEAELEAAADRRAEALARRAASRGPDHIPRAADSEVDDETSADDLASESSHIVDVEEDEHIEEVGGEGADRDTPKTIAVSVARSAEVISELVEERAPASAAHSDDHFEDEPSEETAASNETIASMEAHGPHHHEAEDDEGEEPEHDEPDAEETDGGEASEASEASEPHHDSFSDQATEFDGEQPSSEIHNDQRPGPHDVQPVRQRRRPRSYKIQEVIKRRQVILVQVVKEERGNKGAALTTYLSLAGRYTVLMPNTARGGGISRKITNPQDRKRLKAIAQELEVPEGMGLIIRTAGAARTKQEIKRDFEYLLRLWESVRDLTLQSTAPSLVYEEGDLIKRSIRDLYNKDVEEVVVAGDAGYQEAAAFMRMLMPSHSKNVVPFVDPTPLFTKYGVERQLNAMFLPQVTLRSGGYIVINQTEALVAIDVNSGKSTREFSIEETALATNLEAADEIARQLKLRDLAGLVVIDFIDMEEKRNNRSVERRLKDALRFDRARIQLGRISHFGLMEMSRQRLRTGVLEGSTSQCPHCQGTGIIRSTESVALAVLRGLEDAITAGTGGALIATTTPAVALYILNSKRAYITEMELRHGHAVTIVGSDRVQGANFTVERGAAAALPVRRPERAAVNMDWGFEGDGAEEAPSFEGAEIEIVDDPEDAEESPARERHSRDGNRSEFRDGGRGESTTGEGEEGSRGRRRRRGRGRGGRDRNGEQPRSELQGERGPRPLLQDGTNRQQPHRAMPNEAGEETTGDNAEGFDDLVDGTEDGTSDEARADQGGRGPRTDEERGDRPGRRRRRGRRGGRRGRDREPGDQARPIGDGTQAASDEADDRAAGPVEPLLHTNGLGPQPDITHGAISNAAANSSVDARGALHHRTAEKRDRPERIWDVSGTAPSTGTTPMPSAVASPEPPAAENAAASPESEPAPVRRRHETGSSEPRIERVVVKPSDGSGGDSSEAADASAAPQRKGWWQRKFGGE